VEELESAISWSLSYGGIDIPHLKVSIKFICRVLCVLLGGLMASLPILYRRIEPLAAHLDFLLDFFLLCLRGMGSFRFGVQR
jgi:hypothetical protein